MLMVLFTALPVTGCAPVIAAWEQLTVSRIRATARASRRRVPQRPSVETHGVGAMNTQENMLNLTGNHIPVSVEYRQ